MYSDWVLLLLFGAAYLWIGVLSYLIWRQSLFLSKLFPKSGERDIRKKFGEVTQSVERFKLDLSGLKEELGDQGRDGLSHIQRLALLRYNPYDDTGGDQSFSVALLNKKGDGVVVTSLHSRSGTRVFGKPVVSGKAEKYQFSKEEAEVLKKAMK